MDLTRQSSSLKTQERFEFTLRYTIALSIEKHYAPRMLTIAFCVRKDTHARVTHRSGISFNVPALRIEAQRFFLSLSLFLTFSLIGFYRVATCAARTTDAVLVYHCCIMKDFTF